MIGCKKVTSKESQVCKGNGLLPVLWVCVRRLPIAHGIPRNVVISAVTMFLTAFLYHGFKGKSSYKVYPDSWVVSFKKSVLTGILL